MMLNTLPVNTPPEPFFVECTEPLMPHFSKSIVAILFISLSSTAWAQGYSSERPRKLVPGVMTTIRDVNIDDAAIDETREFTELISVVKPPEWTPNFDPTTETLLQKAKSVGFQRDVWSLQFSFKPLRTISVGGRPVYYLIYSVRNNGETRSPKRTGTTIEVKGERKAIRFIPSFVVLAHDLKRPYRETNRPDVVSRIATKERVTRGLLHDSYSISNMDIPVSTPTADRPVWGVATWDNIDPRADYLSVFVGGLTNAYKWEPPNGGYDESKTWLEQDVVRSKTLQLNFWRGGDNVNVKDSEFKYGLPVYPNQPTRQRKVLDAYKLDKLIKYRWVYR